MFGKKFWIGVGVVAGFAAGALLYGYFTKQDIYSEQIKAQLQQIGPVKRNEDGTLRTEFFCKFFGLISKYGKKASSEKKKEFTQKRRECLSNEDDAQYRKVITEQMMAEEQIFQQIASFCLKEMGIKDEEFLMSQQQNMSNPQFQKAMMEAQIQSANDDKELEIPEHLTKQKTIQIYKFLNDQKKQLMMKEMKAQMAGGAGQEGGANDPTLEMMVSQCKISDMIAEKYGVDEQQFAKAVQHFNIMEVPQIKKMHQMEQMMQMLQAGGQPMG